MFFFLRKGLPVRFRNILRQSLLFPRQRNGRGRLSGGSPSRFPIQYLQYLQYLQPDSGRKGPRIFPLRTGRSRGRALKAGSPVSGSHRGQFRLARCPDPDGGVGSSGESAPACARDIIEVRMGRRLQDQGNGRNRPSGRRNRSIREIIRIPGGMVPSFGEPLLPFPNRDGPSGPADCRKPGILRGLRGFGENAYHFRASVKSGGIRRIGEKTRDKHGFISRGRYSVSVSRHPCGRPTHAKVRKTVPVFGESPKTAYLPPRGPKIIRKGIPLHPPGAHFPKTERHENRRKWKESGEIGALFQMEKQTVPTFG